MAAGHKFAKAVINNVPQEKAMFLERFPFREAFFNSDIHSLHSRRFSNSVKYVTISPAYYSKLSQEAKDIPFKFVSDNLVSHSLLIPLSFFYPGRDFRKMEKSSSRWLLKLFSKGKVHHRLFWTA